PGRRGPRRVGGGADASRQPAPESRDRRLLLTRRGRHTRGEPADGRAGRGGDAARPARREARGTGQSRGVAAARPAIESAANTRGDRRENGPLPIDAAPPREIPRDLRNGKVTGITAGPGANP